MDSATREEKRRKAEQEYKALCQWEKDETRKAIQKLKDENRFSGGLDGKYEELDRIKDERQRRWKEIYIKLHEDEK